MEGSPLHSGAAPDAAVVLPLFGVFLLMPPIITLFASGFDIHGVPLIVVYVFSVWIALIVCAALLAKRLDPTHLEQATSPEVDTDVHRQ
jgi:Fe2+ transport system protein B